METPAQTCLRLMAALEDLTAQEVATMEARDFAGAIALQDRATPLIERLARFGSEFLDQSLRTRMLALLARRNRTGEWLAEQIACVRADLEQAQTASCRVAQIAPAYGQGRSDIPPRRQLTAVG
jgi:hypothetical protein